MSERDGEAPLPPRPTIALPPQSSMEGLFRSGGGGGSAADVSPGPMTLLSSFFAEDPDSEYRCFSQLLAGAIESPVMAPPRRPAEEQAAAPAKRDSGRGGEGERIGLGRNHSPLVTVPPGLSPSSLLESPAGLFSSNLGYFEISHHQALAQATAQAEESHSYMHVQTTYPSLSAVSTSVTQPTGSSINMSSLQLLPPLSLDTNSTMIKSDGSHSEHQSQPAALIFDKPADDGYNWRKYGQKQVKGGEYPRSYYKCTHPNCPVKKKVERSLEGQVTEIIYKGQHNHPQPSQNRRSKEGGTFASGCNELNGSSDFPTNPETSIANFGRSAEVTSKRDRDSSNWTPEQLSDSSEGEEGDGKPGTGEGGDSEQDLKRRNIDNKVMESTSHKTVTEPRIIVQTTSEVDLLDDGYKWRKYGQKVVKGNPHPRSYYRCTNMGCNVRKHIERASTDPKAVITTYEGKHNHDVPAARNSSHAIANAGAATSIIQPKAQNANSRSQPSLRGTEFRNNVGRPVAVYPLKKEHDIA